MPFTASYVHIPGRLAWVRDTNIFPTVISARSFLLSSSHQSVSSSREVAEQISWSTSSSQSWVIFLVSFTLCTFSPSITLPPILSQKLTYKPATSFWNIEPRHNTTYLNNTIITSNNHDIVRPQQCHNHSSDTRRFVQTDVMMIPSHMASPSNNCTTQT